MAKKLKRRKSRGGSGGSGQHEVATPALAAHAREALDGGHWRDAVAAFKELLKREARSDWRAALAEAYAGRAKQLADKGMLKEALAIWQNRAALDPDAPMPAGHAALLVRLGEVDAVIELVGGGAGALPKAQLEALRGHLAARFLGGDRALLERLSDDDPVRRHGEAALAALTAYCDHDDEALRAAMAQIPFRSPYRDWVQVLKALLRQPEAPAEAATLLSRIGDDSAFAPLRRAAQLSLLPQPDFLDATRTAAAGEVRMACMLRGWPPARIAVWEDMRRLGPDPAPRDMLRLLHRHAKVLGADWVRRKSLSLAAGGDDDGLHWLREAGSGHPNRFEQALLAAWTTEPHRDPWQALERWQLCAQLLEARWRQQQDPDTALRIALLLRRGDAVGNMLGDAEPSNDPDDFDRIAAAQLEASLTWDPHDRATWLRLIGYYRRGRRLKDARRLLEQAQARWPNDLPVLEAAMDIALDAGSFKKAAGLARQILAVDPINTGVRRRLVDAHLAHAHKQVDKGRTDLARKELAAALDWARDEATRKRLRQTTALLAVIDGDKDDIEALRADLPGGSLGLDERLELMLAADGLGLSQDDLARRLRLKKPAAAGRDDLAAALARLRTALDGDEDLSHGTLHTLGQALRRSPWRELSRTELETACDTLDRLDLGQAREAAATAALKRWRGEPVFELHRFEARYPFGFDGRSPKDLWNLEKALERAREQGDMRTAIRIQAILPWSSPFGGLPPFPPIPPEAIDFSDEANEQEDFDATREMIIDLIRALGPARAFKDLGAPAEVVRNMKDLERRLGRRLATEELIAFLEQAGSGSDPFADLLPPPAPRRGRAKGGPEDDDEDDFPSQLDLF